jgi:hypothetical protein
MPQVTSINSTYCGGITGSRVRIPGVITVKYQYPALFFTDAIVLTRPATADSVAWRAAQLANSIPGGPGVGFGLPVRPFLRHDFFKVTAKFTELTRGGGAGLTSEKAAAALHGHVHVLPTAQVTRLHIADVWSHKNVRFRIHYGVGRNAEFIVTKSSSAAVTNILKKTFEDRFGALLR